MAGPSLVYGKGVRSISPGLSVPAGIHPAATCFRPAALPPRVVAQCESTPQPGQRILVSAARLTSAEQIDIIRDATAICPVLASAGVSWVNSMPTRCNDDSAR